MRPQILKDTLVYAINTNRKLLIKGAPGIGKTDIMKQACKKAGADLIVSHPVVSDPTDYKGLPGFSADGKEAHFVPFGELLKLVNAKKKTVYFLDDLGQAPGAVQAACFPAGTQILGRDYINIENIKEGDEVIGDDGNLHKVTFKFESPYTDKMYTINSINRIPVDATKEHPFHVIKKFQRGNRSKNKNEIISKPKWTEAQNLQVGDYVGTPIIKPTVLRTLLPVDRLGSFSRDVILDDKFARFLGYYVGNGYSVNHPSVNRIAVCFNLKHKDKIEDCRSIMTDIFGKHVFERVDHNYIHLGIHDNQLKDFFHLHCGEDVYSKKIPNFILHHENEEFLRQFLIGYLRTDGTVMISKGVTRGISYSTVSRTLALQTQAALLRLGGLPGIKIKPSCTTIFPNGKEYNCRESYSIQCSSKLVMDKLGIKKDEMRTVNYSFIHKGNVWTKITSIDTYDYDGIVHNIEVADVNTYTANNYTVHNCMQLLLAREINGHKISDHVVFMAATNRRQDRAGVQAILEPVKSRFDAIIELETNVDDWVEWANRNDMPTSLISFLKYRPSLMHDFIPTADMVNTPSPRTVESVGKFMNDNVPAAIEFEMFAGAAGEAFAVEFTAFLKIFRSLPDVYDIIENPTKAKAYKPEDTNGTSLLYAVSGALAAVATHANFGNIIKYAERLPIEYTVMLIKHTVMQKKTLISTPGFKSWAKENADHFYN
jgi:intein/homing endonuclease